MKDYEQIISTLLTKIAELEQVVKQQAARIADLERRLNKNISNSSKPPSLALFKQHATTSSLPLNERNRLRDGRAKRRAQDDVPGELRLFFSKKKQAC